MSHRIKMGLTKMVVWRFFARTRAHYTMWAGSLLKCSTAQAFMMIVSLIALSLPAQSQTAAGVARDMLASTAQIVVHPERGGRRSGSSIVVSTSSGGNKAVLLTAAHLMTATGVPEILAVLPLRRTAVPARLVAVDEQADLAILEVDDFQGRPITFSEEAMLGDTIWVASFPWGGRATVVSGMVSQIDWDPSGPDEEVPVQGPVALIDATVSHGMSGGGVFKRDGGELVGIVRSHRSVKVTLPGEPERSITLPVAGETNVVSTQKIMCFLAAAGYRELLPSRGPLAEASCRTGS